MWGLNFTELFPLKMCDSFTNDPYNANEQVNNTIHQKINQTVFEYNSGGCPGGADKALLHL